MGIHKNNYPHSNMRLIGFLAAIGSIHPNSTNLFTVEVTTENKAPGAPKQHFKSKKKLSINPGLSICYRSGLNGKSTCVSELELATGIMKKGCSQNFMPETGPVNHQCGGGKSGFLCVWDNRPMSNFHTNLMVYEWQRMRDAFFLGAIFKFLLAVLIVVALYRFCMSVCDTGIPALNDEIDFNLKLSIRPKERVEPATV